MKKHLLIGAVLMGGLVMAQTGRVGIETDNPTETLHVQGTARITDLPKNNTEQAIHTYTEEVNGEKVVKASTAKDKPFRAKKTVVVDENGVLGVVDGTPVTELPPAPDIPKVRTIQYTAKTTELYESDAVEVKGKKTTASESEIKLGNLAVRYEATKKTGTTDFPIAFKLIGDIIDKDGNEADADNVICNVIKTGSGGSGFGGQKKFFSAQKGKWNRVSGGNLEPNLRNQDFAILNISLLNTREVYRLTVSLNTEYTGSGENKSSKAQVSLFLERLTNS